MLDQSGKLSVGEAVHSLKRTKKAIILAHTYQSLDVQDLADRVGDSLELSKFAAEANAPLIVFCGVRFMAETAKLLSPHSTVLLPISDSGCFMADMMEPEDVLRLKAEHPKAEVVAYVNSTVEVKAQSDVCCTSANALAIVDALECEEAIMVPDRNLARYVASRTKKRVFWHDGFCPVHVRITKNEVIEAKSRFPNAVFVAHPECEPDVLAMADEIRSTSGMLSLVKEKDATLEWIIGTEATVVERLSRDYPTKKFHSVGSAKYCINMRKTRPTDVLNALKRMHERIEIDPEHAEKARRPIQRMLSLLS